MDKIVKYTGVFEANKKAYDNKRYRVIANQGSTRCFASDTLVICEAGYKPISEVKPGEFIKSCIDENDCFLPVSEVIKTINIKPTIKLKLKNGKQIICTEDHKFYFDGKWTEIKDILKKL